MSKNKNKLFSIKLIFQLLFIVLGILWSMQYAEAQSVFNLSGEIRPRAELRHGFATLAGPNQQAAFFIDQRSRINFGFTHKKVEFKLTLQDVRTWGSQKQLVVADGNLTTLHEGWGRIYLHDKFSFKVGRQEISYDDHRIFGNVGWAQQARSHDAALFIYDDSTYQVHVGTAFNQNAPALVGTNYTVGGSYKTFQYLWGHGKWGPIGASILFLNNGLQTDKEVISGMDTTIEAATKFSQTMGTRISFKKKEFPIAANASFYYQMGKSGDRVGTAINGYNMSFDISYLHKRFSITAGMEFLSGNNQTDTMGTATQRAFAPLYGTNHKFNGWMDYFYVGNHGGSVGLVNPYLTFKVNVMKKFKLGLTGHLFMTAGKLLDPTDANVSAMPSYLGTEIDFWGALGINQWASLKFGYSQMIGSQSMAVLKGTVDASGNPYSSGLNNWAWLMIKINPSFSFEIKKKKDK